MSKVTTIAKLRVGQRFSWIPADWYGPARLTEKRKRVESRLDHRMNWFRDVKYDLVYDAAVVNPPGISYGVPAKTKVRVLVPQRKLKRKK